MLLWLWIVVGFATLVCAVVGVAWENPCYFGVALGFGFTFQW